MVELVRSLMRDLFDFIFERPDIVLNAVIEHVYITVVALLAATVIGITLGVLITRVRFLYDPILTVAGAIYTVPSIAMFVIMIRLSREVNEQGIPVLKDLFGVGFNSAVIALTLYLLLMIIRNTAVGIDSVDPEIIEAAQGMGMTQLGILLRVELPLALPIIFAGLRIATVSAISLATIAAFIGAGGIGDLIFQGIDSFESQRSKVVAGAVATSIMAIGAEAIFHKIELGVSPGLAGESKSMGETISDWLFYLRSHPDVLILIGVVVLLLSFVGLTWVEPFAEEPGVDELFSDPGAQRLLNEANFSLEQTGYDLSNIETDAPIRRSLRFLPILAIAVALVAGADLVFSLHNRASADFMLLCGILTLLPLLHFYFETQNAVGQLGTFSELFRKLRSDTIEDLRNITGQRVRIGSRMEDLSIQVGFYLTFVGAVLIIIGAFFKSQWIRRLDREQEAAEG